MDVFAVLRPFISISIISRRWEVDNKRLCAIKLRLEEFPLGWDRFLYASSVGQCLTHGAPLPVDRDVVSNHSQFLTTHPSAVFFSIAVFCHFWEHLHLNSSQE